MSKVKNLTSGTKFFYSALILFDLLLVILVVADGTYLGKSYLEAWNKDYYKNFEDSRLQLIAHGILAESIFNLQPWQVKLNPRESDEFDLLIDPEKLLPGTFGLNAIFVSHGAFIEHLFQAGDQLGFTLSPYWFPKGLVTSGSDDDFKNKPVAQIKIHKSSGKDNPFYQAMFIKCRNMAPYVDRPLRKGEFLEMEKLIDEPEIEAELIQVNEKKEILQNFLVSGIERSLTTDETGNTLENVFRLNERSKNHYKWGMSLEPVAYPNLLKFFMQARGSIFHCSRDEFIAKRKKELLNAVLNTPAFLILKSERMDPEFLIKLGMICSRLNLAANLLQMRMDPVSIPLLDYTVNNNFMQKLNKNFSADNKKILMIFRIGYPTRFASHAPRLTMKEILVN